MTDRDRFLAALRLGPVASTDFLRPADGGKPILRLAARKYDLEQQGFTIRSERLKNGTALYTLVSEPPPPVVVERAVTSNSSSFVGDGPLSFDGALFDESVGRAA